MRLVLYAVSTPQASELLESVCRLRWEVVASVRNVAEAPVPAELEPVLEADELDPALLELPFAVPQARPDQRQAAVADAHSRGFSHAARIVDPSAVVAASAALGEGIWIGAGAVIGAACALGDGCMVNRTSSIGHHVQFGDYVTTGPGIVVSGCCRIERGAFLGAACVLSPELLIGEGAVVGAGAVVIRDVPAGAVVVGNPARVLS